MLDLFMIICFRLIFRIRKVRNRANIESYCRWRLVRQMNQEGQVDIDLVSGNMVIYVVCRVKSTILVSLQMISQKNFFLLKQNSPRKWTHYWICSWCMDEGDVVVDLISIDIVRNPIRFAHRCEVGLNSTMSITDRIWNTTTFVCYLAISTRWTIHAGMYGGVRKRTQSVLLMFWKSLSRSRRGRELMIVESYSGANLVFRSLYRTLILFGWWPRPSFLGEKVGLRLLFNRYLVMK
jgi:hypothetical protein